ncbi:hypothetical protein INR49_013998 [Caranx melampygus]|nr:hypothetical protein INR49_013998 [Caranx melampygus]
MEKLYEEKGGHHMNPYIVLRAKAEYRPPSSSSPATLSFLGSEPSNCWIRGLWYRSPCLASQNFRTSAVLFQSSRPADGDQENSSMPT